MNIKIFQHLMPWELDYALLSFSQLKKLSKLPIKSSDFLKYYDQDILIVPLAWNFYREIKNKVKKLRKKNNDKFVIFYPKFKVI